VINLDKVLQELYQY